ncbi:MAG TPA: guanylate kinase [Fimbriimonas sp.]|nr:guanylate kinase [Fimbriimonas sp.]
METGKLVILSGPSGVGKDTVIEAWRARNPRVQRVVAYTTRHPRPTEQPGIDYNFVSPERFMTHVDAGDFLEYKEVYGNHYATPLLDMRRMLDEGKIAILKIDVQGALTAMDLLPEALSVFILPPSTEELVRRIRGRGTENDEAMARRIENAHREIAQSENYRHRIVNDDLERVVEELERIVG